MLIDSGKFFGTWSQARSVITTREKLKKNTARKEFKNLITQRWRRTEQDWTKKES